MDIPKIDVINEDYILINGCKGIKISSCGIRRSFYDQSGLFVVKIEWDDDCYGDRTFYWQCKNEDKTWKKIDREDKRYFAEIIDYSHRKKYDYIVQKRYKFKSYHPRKVYKNIIEPLAHKYGLADLGDDINWKITIDNCPIIHDYGV